MNTRIFFIILAIAAIAFAGIIFWSQRSVPKQSFLPDGIPDESVNIPIAEKNSTNLNTNIPQEKIMTLKKPEMIIDSAKTYKAVVRTTAGDMEIALNAQATPMTVNNFVYLARQGFYDGTIFHRVIKLFMIQGGDPRGDGTGGPGYRFDDELFSGEYERGTVAMANAGPNTNGSQFFIMHADYPLPPNYVIFGKLVSGFETLDAIAGALVERSPSGELSKPVNPVRVTKVEIAEK